MLSPSSIRLVETPTFLEPSRREPPPPPHHQCRSRLPYLLADTFRRAGDELEGLYRAILEGLLPGPNGRVAIETLVTTNLCVMAGEVTTTAKVNFERIARDTIRSIGYTDPTVGFSDTTVGNPVITADSSPLT